LGVCGEGIGNVRTSSVEVGQHDDITAVRGLIWIFRCFVLVRPSRSRLREKSLRTAANMNKEQAELRELTSTPGILFRLSTCVGNKCARTDSFVLPATTTLAELAKIANPKTFSSSVERKHTPRKLWEVLRSWLFSGTTTLLLMTNASHEFSNDRRLVPYRARR